MTRIGRLLTLLTLFVGALVGTAGSTAPAQATFSDSTASVSTSIGTATVAPVGSFVGAMNCTGGTPQLPKATMSATWTASTSARVSGYVLQIHWSDGALDSIQLPKTATSWSHTTDKYWVTAYSVQYSVTTVTDYGWTTRTALTPSFQC
jgi:hypothetical protein